MRQIRLTFVIGLVLFGAGLATANVDSQRPPNVLFIAVDDLNDWIGCLGGHPQAKTPNIDRLAESGMLFSNAHCAAPACNPSRTAIMTGISPHRSGLYSNGQKMREILPKAQLIPKHFSGNGYRSMGSGKILHYFIDADSWDEYYPKKQTENPFPRTLHPSQRPVSLPRGGPWQYVETDWAALDATDEEYGGDWLVSKWVGEKLLEEHDQPFFLACGIYRPHEPWFVPKSYFEAFPLDSIQLPPGYKEGDLDDLPDAGKKRGPNRYFAHIREQHQWREAIQGYLASIAFADAMVGRVLDALDSGPNRDNTIVVLWSDHGWHLGEKQHWQKYTGWRVCTRVPLIIRAPEGTPGLPGGTCAGCRCTQPVSLLSLFSTLTQLTGIASSVNAMGTENDGPSLVPLLKDPNSDWPHLAVTHLSRPKNYSISGRDWRYIHYEDGGEELYQIKTDRYEWSNLAALPEYAGQLADFRNRAPRSFQKLVEPSYDTLPKLTWQSARSHSVPPSRPDGNTFDVIFFNQTEDPVNLFWMDREGKSRPYGQIKAKGFKRQRTRPGAVWLISDAQGGEMGYFEIGDRMARGVIPDSKD